MDKIFFMSKQMKPKYVFYYLWVLETGAYG
jgi:hypothetical protein